MRKKTRDIISPIVKSNFDSQKLTEAFSRVYSGVVSPLKRVNRMEKRADITGKVLTSGKTVIIEVKSTPLQKSRLVGHVLGKKNPFLEGEVVRVNIANPQFDPLGRVTGKVRIIDSSRANVQPSQKTEFSVIFDCSDNALASAALTHEGERDLLRRAENLEPLKVY